MGEVRPRDAAQCRAGGAVTVRRDKVGAHHVCGLLVVFGVMVWLAVEIALKVAGEVTW